MDYKWLNEGPEPFTAVEQHGWTWVETMTASPKTWSLLDADGELMGDVYQRFSRVICWAPFTWAEEVYRSEEDIGQYGFEDEEQRQRHFAKIGAALRDWVRCKREDGVDIPLLRDTYAYYFEASNGHSPMTARESEYPEACPPPNEVRPAPTIAVDDWQAETAYGHCEGYRLRDETEQLRGDVQVRFGVVRVVAARPEDADKMDPSRNPDYNIWDEGRTACRGQIVLQERLRPMALAFNADERESWLRRAVEAIRATPDPDRA